MALVPPAVVTVTSTVPIPAGEVAVIWVALLTVKEAAALLPKLTAVAPEKLVPVMVTLVPPCIGPVFGLTLATAGGPNCAVTVCKTDGYAHVGFEPSMLSDFP
jgi:hypothetical protein